MARDVLLWPAIKAEVSKGAKAKARPSGRTELGTPTNIVPTGRKQAGIASSKRV